MSDVRPIVAIRRRDRSPLYFAIGAALAAVLLFVALDSRRRAFETTEQPATAVTVRGESVPELLIPYQPDEPIALSAPKPWPRPGQLGPAAQLAPTPQAAMPRPLRVRSAPTAPQYVPSQLPYQPPMGPIVDSAAGNPPTPLSSPVATQGPTDKLASGRVMAGRLENPSTTIPQGTLISAVLETGLDSTGAGYSRALVTRDVHSFDGTRLLIPRGSRLYGSYEAGVGQGQKRALIRWNRLLRPDGVTINLDSPASDPLGRAGVPGKVNSHFLQRLGNALLSSTVGMGGALLSRNVSPVVVMPGAQAVTPALPTGGDVKPTLTVKPGARVSVFVRHDLDFSSVDGN